MRTRTKILILAGVSVAQLAAAAASIVRYESVLSSGAQYRIRVAPVDPADAFRGRYVAVQPEIVVSEPVTSETERLLEEGVASRPVYVTLGTDADDFAYAAMIGDRPPEHGDYLEVRRVNPVWVPNPDDGGKAVRTGYTLGFAFDRYYMNEASAASAEAQYADATRRNGDRTAWLVVRVKDGAAVIEGLFLDGVPIEVAARSAR